MAAPVILRFGRQHQTIGLISIYGFSSNSIINAQQNQLAHSSLDNSVHTAAPRGNMLANQTHALPGNCSATSLGNNIMVHGV